MPEITPVFMSFTPSYLLLYQEQRAIYIRWESMDENDSQVRKFVNS